MSKFALIGLFFFPLIVSLLAVKDIIGNKQIENNIKIAWIVAVVLIPLFGAIGYFFFGKAKNI
jgi:predicted Na+-dependent transporter